MKLDLSLGYPRKGTSPVHLRGKSLVMYQMINERTLSHKRKTLHMRLLSNDCAAAAGMMNAFIVKDLALP